MNRIVGTLIFLTGLVAPIAGCTRIETKALTPNLQIAATTCKESTAVQDPGTPTLPDIIDSEWKTSNVLEVKVRGRLVCDANTISGAHAVIGNSLELAYFGSKTGPQPACSCYYHLTYRISGLEKRNYKFVVENLVYDNDARQKWSARLPR
jgi:hypothetical protein